VVRIISPGGGGRGDPMAREPEAVLRDVRAGRLSEAAAKRDYGVALRDGTVDADATSALRASAAPRAGLRRRSGARRA